MSKYLILLYAAFFACLQLLKGYSTFSGIEYHAIHYWFLNYSGGFINRGLLGTLFRGSIGEFNPLDAVNIIPQIYLTFFVICVIQLAAIVPYILSNRNLTPYLLALLIFANSQTFATLGFTVGYPDLICFVLITFALLAALNQRVVICITLNIVGPLIHESYVFMSLPVLVLSISKFDRREWRPWVIPLLVGLLAHFFDSPERALQSLQGAPISAAGLNYLASYGLNQTFSLTVSTLIQMYRDAEFPWMFVILSVTPSVLTLILILSFMQWSGRTLALIAISLVSSSAILIFGWDTFRFLIFSQFAALHIVIWLTAKQRWYSERVNRAAIVPVILSFLFLFEPIAVFTANKPVLCENLQLTCRPAAGYLCTGQLYRELREAYYGCGSTR